LFGTEYSHVIGALGGSAGEGRGQVTGNDHKVKRWRHGLEKSTSHKSNDEEDETVGIVRV